MHYITTDEIDQYIEHILEVEDLDEVFDAHYGHTALQPSAASKWIHKNAKKEIGEPIRKIKMARRALKKGKQNLRMGRIGKGATQITKAKTVIKNRSAPLKGAAAGIAAWAVAPGEIALNAIGGAKGGRKIARTMRNRHVRKHGRSF